MINEMLTALGFDERSQTIGFKCTILGKNGIYIEGVTRIVKFEENEICLKVKKSKIVITGQNLYLKNMSEQDALISGKIQKVEMVEDREYAS